MTLGSVGIVSQTAGSQVQISTLDADATSLVLDEAANDFGIVSVTTSAGASLADANGVVLAGSSVGTNFSVTAGASIASLNASTVLTVGGNLSLTAGDDLGTSSDPLAVRVTGTASLAATGSNIFVTSDQTLVVDDIETGNGADEVRISTTGSADLTLTGTGGYSNVATDQFFLSTDNGHLIIQTTPLNVGSLDIQTGTGDVTISADTSATGHVTINSGRDFTLDANTSLSSTAGGNVEIDAARTITLQNGSSIATLDAGQVALAAVQNILLHSGSSVTTLNGGITLSANQQATPTAGSFVGIDVIGGTIQTTGTGQISLRGRGGNSGNFQEGILLRSGGQVIGGSGTVTVEGQGGASTGFLNIGVQLTGLGSQITSNGGTVMVTGNGGGSGSSDGNHGVFLQNQGQIAAGGAGTVSVMGVAGNTAGEQNKGVFLDSNAQISSAGGDVSVAGFGGGAAGSGTANIGLLVIDAQILAGGFGTLTVRGQGGGGTGDLGDGVRINSGSLTSSGGIQIQGTAGGGSGFGFHLGGTVTASDPANVTIISDSVDLASVSGINAGANTVTLLQETDGTAIDLGGADAPGTLGLTNAELNRITAGTIVIGNSDSGSISVTAAISHSGDADFLVTTGRNILFQSGSSWTTTDGDLTFSANQQATPAGGTFAGIELHNAHITSANGNVALTGRGGDTGDDNRGVFLHSGSTIVSTGTAAVTGGAGLITITGSGGEGAANRSIGVDIEGAGTAIQSQEGNISITGTGGDNSTGFDSVGVAVTDGASVESFATAAISLMGTGKSGTHDNAGVVIEGVVGLEAVVRSVDGNISIAGVGGAGTEIGNHGIEVVGVARIQSTGLASITLDGTGGTGPDENAGILLAEGGHVTSETGAILLMGQGGSGAGGAYDGIQVFSGATIESTGVSPTAAAITLIGNGGIGDLGDNIGIAMEAEGGPGGIIQSIDGAIHLTGAGGSGGPVGNKGIEVSEGSVVRATGLGPVTLVATLGDIVLGNGLMSSGALVAGGGGISATAGSGSILEEVIDANPKITTPGPVVLSASGSIGGAGTDADIDIHNATALDLTAGDDLAVRGNGQTLASLALTLDPTGAATYRLANFTGLNTDISTDGTDLTVSTLSAAAATDFSLTAAAGDFHIGTVDAVTGTVLLTSAAGRLLDANGTGNVNVSAGQLGAVAATGIDLDTEVGTLALHTDTGEILIRNSGALVIGAVGPLVGATNSAGGGTIQAASPLFVNAAVSMGADFTLEAVGSSNPGDNLTINADITHTGSGDDPKRIRLLAGDD
ncbi:MAG TPA: hypothetical protein VML55_16805, partial [Planctomycetaceae bacterium]|nr:hypothetical protein [Planctomycetaceae bacterium]